MEELRKSTKFNVWYVFIAIMTVVMVRDFIFTSTKVQHIPYSEFKELLRANKISKVIINKDTIKGTLINESDKTEPKSKNSYVHTNRVDPELVKELKGLNIEYSQNIENTFLMSVLSWVLPFLLFFWLWGHLGKKIIGKGGMGGGFMSVGKSKAKIYMETDTKITFNDVAGADEAKSELIELVDFLTEPNKYNQLGSRMPKGVLLVGPPGTGKTLIAKAVAGEASVPFFSTNGAEFVEMFVGVGAARVRDLFDQAKKQSPCIIFIDELDALGKARMSGPMSHGNDEKEQTLNQLLVELDGFDSSSGIVLLAATNRPEILDPALLRSGRFDRQVLVDKPDRVGRFQILKLHSKEKPVEKNVNLEKIAAITPGFTGADLENLVNEASLIAVRKKRKDIRSEDFTEALERIIAGLEKKNRLINPFERKVVAFHEMGHAIVARAINKQEPVHKVSIIPRGIGSLGYTIQRPTEERYLMTKNELTNKMTVLLGGRAAETITFGHFSTGASDDLEKATDIAWNIVTKYGMDETLGNVVYDKAQTTFLGNSSRGQNIRSYSDITAREIDCAVKGLVSKSLQYAIEVLKKNNEFLTISANLLLEKETLNEDDLKPIFDEVKNVDLS